MEIVNCTRIFDFSNTTRKYYNLYDVRISDVNLYNTNDVHRYHIHHKTTEILFVLDGSIRVKIKENRKITEFAVNKNKIVIFKPGESHTVSSIDNNARVMVFKYLSKNENLLEMFINDFEEV